DQLSSFFERVAALSKEQAPSPPPAVPLIGPAEPLSHPERWAELFGGYSESVRLIAQRTAEMHRALAADRSDPAFAPEPFSRLHQRSLYQSMRNLTGRLFTRLLRERHALPEVSHDLADRLLSRQEDLLQRFKAVLDRSINGYHIRCHGNYHLAQLLYT